MNVETVEVTLANGEKAIVNKEDAEAYKKEFGKKTAAKKAPAKKKAKAD